MFGENVPGTDLEPANDAELDDMVVAEDLPHEFHANDDSLPLETKGTIMLLPAASFWGDFPIFTGITVRVDVPPLTVPCEITGVSTRPPGACAVREFFGKMALPGKIVTEFVSGVAQNALFVFDGNSCNVCSALVADGAIFESFWSAITNLICVPERRR